MERQICLRKPVGLLGVAAGAIGAIKALEHLRSVLADWGYRLPLPVSVPYVQRVFDVEGRCLDPSVEKLVRSVATNLLHYMQQNICLRVTLERVLHEGVAVAIGGETH